MRKVVYPFVFAALITGTIVSFAVDDAVLMFPMFMTCEIWLALWLFGLGPASSRQGKAAYYSIIAFGVVSVLLSYAFSILIPMYGEAWGVDSHPNDAQGILYPIVNDFQENCALGSIVFLFYFGISLVQRAVAKENQK
jgi:hypothetical protein